MKFTIDTERKEITLLEAVKLGELQKVLFGTVLNWEEYQLIPYKEQPNIFRDLTPYPLYPQFPYTPTLPPEVWY